METLTLTNPITPPAPTTSTYHVASLYLGWKTQRIIAVLEDNNGIATTCNWDGATAVALMTGLNKANLSIKSLHKRVIEQAQADGKLPAGSVTGSPD